MSYLIKALKDKSFENKVIIKTKINRKLLKKTLLKYKFIKKIYKSDANFMLIKLRKLNASEFQNILKKEKIMIQDCSSFDFLTKKLFRSDITCILS